MSDGGVTDIASKDTQVRVRVRVSVSVSVRVRVRVTYMRCGVSFLCVEALGKHSHVDRDPGVTLLCGLIVRIYDQIRSLGAYDYFCVS